MEISSFKPAILSPVHFLNAKHSKLTRLPCLRKNGGGNELFNTSIKWEIEGFDNPEMSQDMFQPSNLKSEPKTNDIWKLFKEAQQNIVYLNKQRLLAVEELHKANQEKEFLLDRIEQLEGEKQAGFGKDKQSMCCELMLRLDSMVLTGMIKASEASNLRKTVMDYKFSIADMFLDNVQKNDVELLAELRHFSYGNKKSGFHIVHVCTELAPVVEVGSLASYVTGLSSALQKKGHFVEVILPKYSCLDLSEIQGLREVGAESYSYFNGQLHGNKIWTGVVNGLAVTFIQPLYYSSYFNRAKVYGYADDFERFSYFSRASLDYIAKSGKLPDILHIHNWETAIVGPLFWDIFVKQGLEGTRILFTCHDLNSQCLETPDKLALCGLDPDRLHRPDRLQDDADTKFVNILKGGLVYSNKVVVVSSLHSKGRIISNLSHGLEHTLSLHSDKLLVSPYGFDDSTWDPSKDKFLPQNYNEDDIKGKAVCKVELQRYLGLPKNSTSVLVGCILSEISDLDLDNLKAVVRNATRNIAQFIFMGSKMPSSNKALESLQKEFKGENVRVLNKYDEAVSHLILGGSDVMLCQSFHDPLLQVPLKALKYGAAPIAVASNAIKSRDFVDHDLETTVFSQFISSTFGNLSLIEAMNEMKNNPSKWRQKIVKAMSMDFSWDAECYNVHVSAYDAIKKL
ncbi:Glycogen synthase [Euphorbia peplus]|nr:Glycogen synthase [Euphorbia peplus]